MILPDARVIRTLQQIEKPNLEILRRYIKDSGPKIDYKKIYETCITIHQKNNYTKGHNLENVISDILDEYGISYKRQVIADKDGIIVPSQKTGRRYDFIIDAKYGDSLNDKIVISCKRSLRERFMQDSHVPCKKLYMVTMEHKTLKFANRLRAEFGINLIVVGGPREFNFGSLVYELMQIQTYDQYGLDYSAEL